jgi:hypothetical protein
MFHLNEPRVRRELLHFTLVYRAAKIPAMMTEGVGFEYGGAGDRNFHIQGSSQREKDGK